MESAEQTFKVMLFPWLAHGHISPFLELAKKLSHRNFQIYFCSTAINLSHIKERLNQNTSSDIAIEFIELSLPDSPELPPHHHTTKGLPPHLMGTLINSFQLAKPNFSNIIRNLNLDLLIYDGFQSWAPTIASSFGVSSVFFVTSGAATMSFFYHMTSYGGKERYPFTEIQLRDYDIKRLHSTAVSQVKNSEFSPFKCFEVSHEIVLIKSCKEIEAKYLDYLSLLSGKKMVPLGPLVQDSSDAEEEGKNSDIIKWLDKKDQSSVVYISFGSEYFLTRNEREEIAHGLELSNVNFIWVLRFPVGNAISIEEALPEGFMDRAKDKGIIVEGWAPQARILEHSSTGGFASHCGWSSIMESFYYHVPVIAMPMCFDQPTNARLVVDIGVGMEVSRDENGEFGREEIARVMKEIVFEKGGEEIRRKSREVGEKIRSKEVEEMDEAIDELRGMCVKGLLN